MSNMHLMAHHLGLGSCWIQGRLRQAEDGTSTEAFCRALLSVPARYTLEAILSLGFPAIQPEPHSLEDLPREKIHWIPSNPFPGTVQKNVCTRSRPGTHVFI